MENGNASPFSILWLQDLFQYIKNPISTRFYFYTFVSKIQNICKTWTPKVGSIYESQ
jgi:hypothetical protein